ncbi:MAG: serine/threonine protein kinase [Deltaproteobacteria bacterium]|nr:serine/threonine protein kinase [Deltaproteobacteria bacterium]
MTTRDPRSRPPGAPDQGGVRERTQSLQIEIDDAEPRDSHPSLAVGTSDSPSTKIESPSGRNKTPQPRDPKAGTKPPPVPDRAGEDPETRIGAVLGTYRLAELLGKGGMGYVYRAEHVKLGREVALKLLRGDYARRRDAVLRFFQEAKTVNRVRHRNIVDVTDFVELDDGTTFIIMEFLRGQSLGKWARTGIDLPRALAVLVQICDGLGAAHAVGVVHRDLKPDNVIVVPTSDGAEMVKLLDFGVAKLVNRDDEDVGFQTAAGSVIGTPAYMSPEQAGGMAVDHRSDIYSLGAIMYELFTGQPMFRGRSFGEYVRKHLTEMPVPPRQTQGGAHLDERLEALILKSLAKDPNERFNHILELRDGLLHMLGGIETHPPGYASLAQSAIRPAVMTTQLPPHMLPLPAPAMATTVPTPPQHMSAMVSQGNPALLYSQYTQQPVAPEPTKTPMWLWLLGAAIAIGGGIGGALWFANRDSNDAPAAPAQEQMATTTPAAPTAPTAAPIEPTQPAGPQLVELRFDSLPAAGVFADGHSAELCHTPCNYTFDVKDGVKRTLVVRAAGYRDKPIELDLTGDKREFSVTLEREPETAIASDPEPTTTNKKTHPGGVAHGAHRPSTKVDVKPETKPEDKPAETKPPETKPDTNLEKPAADPTPTKKPDDKIDPADTHDPFRRH